MSDFCFDLFLRRQGEVFFDFLLHVKRSCRPILGNHYCEIYHYVNELNPQLHACTFYVGKSLLSSSTIVNIPTST